MTNFEKIKGMDVKQLANFFASHTKCNNCFLYAKCCEFSYDGCREVFRKWLESEVEK